MLIYLFHVFKFVYVCMWMYMVTNVTQPAGDHTYLNDIVCLSIRKLHTITESEDYIHLINDQPSSDSR